MSAAQLVKLLQEGGGWGLSAILLVAVVYLWFAYVKVRDRYEAESKEQNKEFTELLREVTTAANTQVSSNQANATETRSMRESVDTVAEQQRRLLREANLSGGDA